MSKHRERMARMGGIEGERAEPAQQSGSRERGEAERGATATSERFADSPIPHMKEGLSLPLTAQIALLVALVGTLFLVLRIAPLPHVDSTVATSTQVSASAASTEESAPIAEESAPIGHTPPQDGVVSQDTVSEPAQNPNEVHRIENPYTIPPLSFDAVNSLARAALVNIFCSSANGTTRPISGSGIVVDPKGIILTNAHVAQYVLLAQSGLVNLQCQIRTGSPAVAQWVPLVLYIPPLWVAEHAADLTKERPFGTGEHDFALLYAGASLDGALRPTAFPALIPDSREAIGFIGDSVLAASYPAEFLGPIASSFNMSPVTSITEIDDLYTLAVRTVDVISIGSVIGAQSGSSGGAIVNAWGRLIGIITTTSDGVLTGERRLRGITLSYIDRDLQALTGSTLSDVLSADPTALIAKFWTEAAPDLVDTLLRELR